MTIPSREETEAQIIALVAADRLYRPISSMGGKLDRLRPKLARAIDLDPYKGKFQGERVYARVEAEDRLKARGMQDGVEQFCTEHPKMGEVLTQMIEDSRSVSETYMHFGVNEGSRLSSEDYMSAMRSLKFSEAEARKLYEPLMEVSRKMAKKREENERAILIG
jgi:hypothetical protein